MCFENNEKFHKHLSDVNEKIHKGDINKKTFGLWDSTLTMM